MYDDEESSSGSDSDTAFKEDLEALRRACSVTGIDASVDDLPKSSTADFNDTQESEDEDLELLRSIQQRFSLPTNIDDIGTKYQPLNTILPSDDNDDYDNDFETLCAIRRRFSQYNDSMNTSVESSLQRSEQVGASNNIDLGKESSPNFLSKRNNNGQGFAVDGRASDQNLNFSSNITPDIHYANLSEGHEPGFELVATTGGGFPRSAQAFVEAIKKNRTCQKFIRNKVIQIEARMEENRKLRERVKILKDFQVACRKRTGRALSQKKDARIQLISIPKQRANTSKSKDKHLHPISHGPAENSQVANYRDAMSKYPFSLSRESWSKEETENLVKGIKQQFQEMLMQNLFSAEGTDSSYLDSMISKIRDHKITSEEIRSFLPKVNWEHLASMYVKGRSGLECQSRWMNCEDPLINHQSWTTQEDKKLLYIIQKQGFSNWINVAKELKTNRTPFQCLSRFQRSLNASIIKNEWTPSDDKELRLAVAEYGETNWQLVASTLEGRTGTQCSNRWKKSLNPLREKVGKWDPDEDKRLKIAVRLFGAKNWNKIAKFVPGRTQVQCRERWVNCLNPSLNMNEWTEEEDLKLKQAIEDHGYCWSRIAACIPPRTDSQCLRRWKVLLPHEVPIQQRVRKMKKAALVSNFVDREKERPDLTVKDFITHPLIESPITSEGHMNSKKRKRRVRPEQCEDDSSFGSRRAKKVTHSEDLYKLIDEDGDDNDDHVVITTNGDRQTALDEENSVIRKASTGKDRSVVKRRSRKARKVTWNEKVHEVRDKDDIEDDACHVEFTTNGERLTAFDGKNATVRKKASVKERNVFKIRSRRARHVTYTEKALKLMDEDDIESNDGHPEITENGEGCRLFDGDNSEIEKKATGKRIRKRRSKAEGEEVNVIVEANPISKKMSMRPCGMAFYDVAEPNIQVGELSVSNEDEAILTSKRSIVDPTDNPCSSADIIVITGEDETHKICNVQPKYPNRNHTETDHVKNEEEDYGYQQTLASFLSNVKKKRRLKCNKE
uniref:myb-like protein L isoform X2 n=1 Tax=Erigeron canadensis TaxID=72917 RepID=UPI001CB96D72|nr:myb-like protein L isoform X2 [Erigeron canadensis]